MSDNSNFTLNVLVVEDDFSFALELQMLLEQMGYRCAGIVDNAENALVLIDQNEPDAILMDIDLHGKVSGLDLAERIKDRKIPVLFITSYKDDATYARAKSLNHIGFLVKPLNDYTLISAIDSCLQNIDSPKEEANLLILNQALLIKKGKLYHKIKLEDICIVSSDKEYITLHAATSKFVVRESLKAIVSLLPEEVFVRTHKSYIINIEHLNSVDLEEGIAYLNHDLEAPISRRNRKLLFDKFKRVN